MRARANYNRHSQGFTIVELVMVIVLLGILSAIALPRFFERSAFEQRVFFDDTLSALRYTQKLAVATGCQTQFQSTSTSYQVLADDSCDSDTFTTAIRNPATNELGFTGSLSGIALTASTANITFFPLGDASTDATVTIAGNTIIIVADTGFIYAQ